MMGELPGFRADSLEGRTDSQAPTVGQGGHPEDTSWGDSSHPVDTGVSYRGQHLPLGADKGSLEDCLWRTCTFSYTFYCGEGTERVLREREREREIIILYHINT